MAFQEIRNADFPLDGAGANVLKEAGPRFNCGQLTDKGYDFQRETASTYVADLEGSVAGEQWTVITAMAADAQGVIPAHYNFVRINCGTAGTYGGDVMKVAGKVL